MMQTDYDAIILGSGSTGLAAALVAAKSGARTLVIEKSELVGGTSAMSGAGTWIPANHHMTAAGIEDSAETALDYMRATAPAGWREKEDDRWRALAENAAPMLAFLEANSPLRFDLAYHPDMYTEAPGGREHGRMVSPRIISKNILPKRWRSRIRRSTMPINATYQELIDGWKQGGSIREILAFAPTVVWRMLRREVGQGNALITGLLKGCLDAGAELVTRTRAVELVTEPATGRVTGVVVEKDGKRTTLAAAKGVVIATGGFEWNEALREKHFPGGGTLIASPRTNTGDGQLMAQAVGAELDHMEQANVFPVVPTLYEGKRHAFPLTEIYSPHCILVGPDGRRFANEGDPNIGIAVNQRDAATGGMKNLPAWKIFDRSHTRRNAMAMRMWKRDGEDLKTAPTIEALARLIDVDPAVLMATVERFNRFVDQGRDDDFHRGETVWERYYTKDARHPERNNSLGRIDTPPFYATRYHHGIIVTKGGPRTSARGEVLRANGSRIGGLYAAGMAAASPIGSKAIGAGTTIGPCLTSGYIAARALLGEN
ncbi:MAG: FAD-dependent oxidoreductase [Hyphomicrobiaceae bacterium]